MFFKGPKKTPDTQFCDWSVNQVGSLVIRTKRHISLTQALFRNPSRLVCTVLCLHLALVVLQLCMLFGSIPWHGYLATFLLLFFNYYTMFKLVRDYLVMWKVYRAEHMIQDKNNSAPVTWAVRGERWCTELLSLMVGIAICVSFNVSWLLGSLAKMGWF